jgi:hypothetical protein
VSKINGKSRAEYQSILILIWLALDSGIFKGCAHIAPALVIVKYLIRTILLALVGHRLVRTILLALVSHILRGGLNKYAAD